MKKIIYTFLSIMIFAGLAFAATYTIKQNGKGTVIKNGNNTQSTNLYNNYSSNQYVSTNAVNNNQTSIVELVMDYSGSMSDVVDIAQNTMANVVAQIPSSTQIGFRVFGQGGSTKKLAQVQSVQKSVDSSGKTVYKLKTGQHQSNTNSCQATELITPIAQANANALINGMKSVDLGGSTPMVLALEKAAYTDLGNIGRNIPKKIVLITDGGENCGGDPCAFAKTLMSTRRDIQIDVVLVSSNSRKLYCLANTTGGRVYNLSNIYQFENVVTQSINTPNGNTPNTNIQTQPDNNQQNYEFLDE